MAKLFDAGGNEVEAFTQDELKAKQQEALDEYIKNNPDKSSEIEKLKNDLKEANDKISSGAGGDAGQARRLKEDRDKIEAELNGKIETLSNDFKTYKESIVGSAKESLLSKLTGGDKDLRAKIELKASNLTGYPDTPEGVAQKFQDAFTLATGNKPTPSMLDGVTGAGARGDGAGKDKVEGMTENGKAMATVFGIKEDSIKKYDDAAIAKAQGKTI